MYSLSQGGVSNRRVHATRSTADFMKTNPSNPSFPGSHPLASLPRPKPSIGPTSQAKINDTTVKSTPLILVYVDFQRRSDSSHHDMRLGQTSFSVLCAVYTFHRIDTRAPPVHRHLPQCGISERKPTHCQLPTLRLAGTISRKHPMSLFTASPVCCACPLERSD